MSHITIKGAKGGAGSFKQTPDNLRSDDTFEGVMGLCIGPIKGPTRGLKSITLDGTAIENATGDLNFTDFVATLGNGDPTAFPQVIQLKLGAGASPTQVGTTLPNNNGTPQPTTKTMTNVNADFVDLRFIVNQLYRQDAKGVYNLTATLKIEMKPVGSTTWINPTIGKANGNYSQSGVSFPGYGGSLLRAYVPRSYYGADGTPLEGQQNFVINGKTTSAVVYELRIALPNTGNYANTGWDIRISLLERDKYTGGKDNADSEVRNIQWESLAAVYGKTLGDHEDWRGVSWLQLYGKASDQLTGVPEVLAEVDTKIMQVPPTSVFNPDTRKYVTNATWDGSWAKAYTNDPGWVVADAISDALSGLSLLAPGSYLNKWDALEMSKWCSEYVPDGNGGAHPRFSLNIAIRDAVKAEDFIRNLAGAVGGLAWDQGDGQWRVKMDKPDNAVDLFTLDNIEGEFIYSRTDVDTRYNDITMTFLNEEMDYREDRVRVFNNPSIALIGRKPQTIVAVGCTNRQEAMRRALLRLITATSETRIVNFTTNRRGRNVEHLDMILVADGDLGDRDKRTIGRTIAVAPDRKSITLRDSVYIAPGVGYNLRFAIPNAGYNPDPVSQPSSVDWKKPSITSIRAVTNAGAGQTGQTATIYLDQALPANIPDNLAVALEASVLVTIPKLYRATNVTVDDDGERINITALEVATGKWLQADNVSKSDTVFVDLRGAVPAPLPPLDGKILTIVRVPAAQGTNVTLTANWIRPAGAYISGFRVRYRINGGDWVIATDQTQFTTLDLVNPVPGVYDVEIVTKDRRGGVSLPLMGTLEVTQSLIDADQIYYNDGTTTVEDYKPAGPGATAGAPAGTKVNGVAVETITATIADLNSPAGVVQSAITAVDTKANGIRTDLAAAQLALTGAQSQIVVVQNQLTVRPNLQKNGNFTNGFVGIDGYNPTLTGLNIDDPLWGNNLYHSQTGTTAINLPPVNVTPSAVYTVSFDSALFASGGTSRVDVAMYDGANATGNITYGPSSSNTLVGTDFSLTDRKSFTFTAPSNCRSIRVRLISENITGTANIVFRRIKVERGSPASQWSDDASVNLTNANVLTETQTRISADSALGTRIDTVTASVKTANDRIDANYTNIINTIGTDKAAQATINGRLYAQVVGGQNLCENGGFERGLDGIAGATAGWSVINGVWGVVANAQSNGTNALNFPRFDVQAGEWYTIAADTLLVASAGSVYVDIIFQDANGNALLDGPEKPYAANHDFAADGSGREAVAVEVQAPANSRYGVPRFVWSGVSGCQVVGVREVMVERGRLPWSPYISSAKSIRKSNAEITSAQETIANTNLSLANYKLDVAAMFSGATGTGLSGRIEDNRMAAATATQAVAQSVSTLSAFAQASPNLVADVTKWGKNAGVLYGNGGWGPQIGGNPQVSGETTFASSPYFFIFPNAAFTLSVDLVCLGEPGNYVWADIVWIRADGSVASYSPRITVNASVDFSNDRPRSALAMSTTAPSDASTAYVRLCGNRTSGNPYFGIRRPKVEKGSIVTAYTAEGDLSNLSATVTQQAGVLADLNGKTQAYFSTAANINGLGTVGIFGSATLQNGQVTSDLALVAGKQGFYLTKPDGTFQLALGIELVNGNPVGTFYGQLRARSVSTNQIILGGVEVSNIAGSGFSSDGAATWQGAVTASALGERKQIPYTLTVPNVQPKGRFLALTATITVTSNAGEQTQANYNGTGKTLYRHIVADWTTEFRLTDPQGNVYLTASGETRRVLATTAFDAQWQAFITRGTQDTGVINGGDYYEQTISATPTAIAVKGNITWLAT